MSVGTSSDDQLGAWIAELINDSQSFDGMEQRGAARTPLVCAVAIQHTFDEHSYHAFSRDISADGIGLITSSNVAIDQTANLSISRFDGASLKVAAVCRWCTPYGTDWYLSGWEYRHLIGVRRF